MYSRQEVSILTQQFWTAFGGYMAPIPSADGEKINWVNYKTGEKDVRFVTSVENKAATISIRLSHKDTALQKIYFDRFLHFQQALQEILGEDWTWALHQAQEDGKVLSEIYVRLENVTLLHQPDWPGIISFFKPRLIGLDRFWCGYKYAFERLSPQDKI